MLLFYHHFLLSRDLTQPLLEESILTVRIVDECKVNVALDLDESK